MMIKFASLFGLAVLSTLQPLTVEAYVSSEHGDKRTSSSLFGDKEDPISFTKHGDEKNSLRGLGGKGTIKKVKKIGGGGRSTDSPSEIPSASPSASTIPSEVPTDSPSEIPSASPSASMIPSDIPTDSPSEVPSASPSMIPGKVPTSRKTRIVRVQLFVCDYLHLREVQVLDQHGVNVALYKVATQSSTMVQAYNAVNGKLELGDYSHTSDCVDNGAWWEVNLGQDVDVTKVIIYNRGDCCSGRLSNSVVSLLNQERSTLKAYAIGNAEKVERFEFNVI